MAAGVAADPDFATTTPAEPIRLNEQTACVAARFRPNPIRTGQSGIVHLRGEDGPAARHFQAIPSAPIGPTLPRPFGALGVNVERARLALDHLRADHHLLDAVEAGEFEHGVKEDPLHDRAQPARAGAALDRL